MLEKNLLPVRTTQGWTKVPAEVVYFSLDMYKLNEDNPCLEYFNWVSVLFRGWIH